MLEMKLFQPYAVQHHVSVNKYELHLQQCYVLYLSASSGARGVVDRIYC